MRRIALLVVRYPWLVIGFWMVVLAAGIPNLERASGSFSQDFSVPGREGFETNKELLARYGVDALTDPIVPVLTFPTGTTASDVRTELAAAEARISERTGARFVAGFGSTGNTAFVSDDGRTTFVLVQPQFRPNQGFDAGLEDLRSTREALTRERTGDPVAAATAAAVASRVPARSLLPRLPPLGGRALTITSSSR